LNNGHITSVTSNGLGHVGQQSCEIIIDVDKVIGTNGQSSLTVIVDELGNIRTLLTIKWNMEAMNLKFNKENFIKINSEFLYGKLLSFLRAEISDFSYQDILKQLKNTGDDTNYEGNQYLITRQKYSETVIVIDEVSEEHGVDTLCTRFTLGVVELAELITDYINTNFEV